MMKQVSLCRIKTI